MMRPHPTSVPRSTALRLAAWGSLALLSGCGTRAPEGIAEGTAPRPLSEAEWQSLAIPRPSPLPGAARLSLGHVELLGTPDWAPASPVPPALGLGELVVAGLLRRQDVQLVERRRFAAAVEAERGGTPLPAGAPRAGTSPGSDLTATIALVRVGTGDASLEVRVAETATGRVAGSRRTLVPANAEPVGLARCAVRALLEALRELGRLPSWEDPVTGAAPPEYVATGVPAQAYTAFLEGLAAEERWRWDAARAGYQAAAHAPGFFEAEAALARTARLRLGGTLGES